MCTRGSYLCRKFLYKLVSVGCFASFLHGASDSPNQEDPPMVFLRDHKRHSQEDFAAVCEHNGFLERDVGVSAAHSQAARAVNTHLLD